MTGYGSSLHGSDWYVSSPYRANTELYVGIRARIIKPISSIPPVMDSISYGLAQRFDWLQQGIQSFALFNKIEYARGTSDGFLPSLDDVWGQLYDLPRLTGESDDDYRSRLQTYVKVLTGSGTVPNTQAVLDFLIGLPGATAITSLWPARATIDFTSIDAMRLAKAKRSLIDSVLPGMFAAGVDYELIIPFLDCYIRAAIKGDAEKECLIRAAVATVNELSCGVDAMVAYGRELSVAIRAAAQIERDLGCIVRAAIMSLRELPCSYRAAIQAEPDLPIEMRAAVMSLRELPCSYRAAIQAEPELPCSYYAAVARNFELQAGILVRIVHMYELSCKIRAAVQSSQELSVGIRARIARRI